MNKYLFILITVIMSNKISFSQSQAKDSLYTYWAKKGIIESTFAYMQDYKSEKGLDDDEEKGLQKYRTTYIQNIDSIQNIDLNDVSAFLNNNSWSNTNKKILILLIKKFNKRNDLNIDFFSDVINGNFTNWNKKTNEIVDSYDQAVLSFNSKKQKTVKPEENSIDHKVDKTQTYLHYSKTSSWPDYVLYISILLLGIIIGGFIVYMKTKNRIRKILNYEYNKYQEESKSKFFLSHINLVEVLKNHKDDYKKSCEDLEDKNSKLKSSLNKLKSNKLNKFIDDLEQEQKTEETISNDIKENIENNTIVYDIKTKPKETKKLFFTIPQNDGSFKLTNAEKANDGKKYYKIEHEEDSKQGVLSYMTSEKDLKAIGLLEKFLEPVCDIENVTSADTASEIEVLNNGKVFLENDKWVIDENNKVKIRLC